MDTVHIRGLRAEAVIGIHDWERDTRQALVIDLELASDNRAAAATDRIEDAVDYAAISSRVVAFVEGSEYQLIETLAERLAEKVMTEFGVAWLRLRLDKPGAVAEADSVGVQIERGEMP
jgi:dihydroneopterin aldolase